MNRVYLPYWKWECYRAGMWESADNELLEEAVLFTGDDILYGGAMAEVIFKWPNTMIHNLTNMSVNRRAFVGHCAVFYKKQIPECVVRRAWKLLTDKQRRLADNAADRAIKSWELWYITKLANTSDYGKGEVTLREYQMKLHLV